MQTQWLEFMNAKREMFASQGEDNKITLILCLAGVVYDKSRLSNTHHHDHGLIQ